MNRIELNGRWEFRECETEDWAPGRVPGSVHGDLLRNNQIPDPFVGTNELDVQWVGRADWEYRRSFRVPASALKTKRQVLVCEGLDTVATVYLNGKKAAATDNMFRRHEIDGAPFLKAGENEIRIVFHSSVIEAARRKKKYNLDLYTVRFPPVAEPYRNLVRKAQYMCGWDWGPCLATCGVWRDIYLVCHDAPRIQHAITEQDHRPDGSVHLRARVWLEVPEACSGRLAAAMDGVKAQSNVLRLKKGEGVATVEWTVENPRLWFPNGHGAQHLYDLALEWRDETGAAVDGVKKRVGLRKVELVCEPDADQSGESFYFRVNGQPIFCKGGNWIPGDLLLERMTRDRYERALRDCAAANINMLRVWGGGIYEKDEFYELCDELGIMIWQDFMFACAQYPAKKWFMDGIPPEIRHQIRRLHDYCCIALWCGNNENELVIRRRVDEALDSPALREDRKIFGEQIAHLVAEEDAMRPYRPTSPFSGAGVDYEDRTRGNIHMSIWGLATRNRRVPIRYYETETPRFVTEFGAQAYPDVETLKTVIRPEDLNASSPAMDHHQGHPMGNSNIVRLMADNFRLPANFEHFTYLSQAMQLWAMQAGIEHMRRLKPYCMGTLYWQLNDCWPAISWASLDYEGRWKALHYGAKRYYNPLLISAKAVEGRRPVLEVWACSDVPAPLKGTWKMEAVALDGKRAARFGGKWKLRSEESRAMARIPLNEALGGRKPNEVVLYLELKADPKALSVEKRHELGLGGEALVSRNSKILSEPKYYALAKTKIHTKVENGPRGPRVRVQSDKPALFVELNAGPLKGAFSDNWVSLAPNREWAVDFRGDGEVGAVELMRALRALSLVETY